MKQLFRSNVEPLYISLKSCTRIILKFYISRILNNRYLEVFLLAWEKLFEAMKSNLYRLALYSTLLVANEKLDKTLSTWMLGPPRNFVGPSRSVGPADRAKKFGSEFRNNGPDWRSGYPWLLKASKWPLKHHMYRSKLNWSLLVVSAILTEKIRWAYKVDGPRNVLSSL